MLSPGDRINDYEVIAPLRSGGMAMLYLARRRGVGGFSRLVALKLVHSHLMRDETITRLFLEEARLSANVSHPNVVNVEEVGKVGENYFIAMEYVHGVSLAELLSSLSDRRMRMSPRLCVWLAAQVAEALHATHEAKNDDGSPLQIVHRDVSPQNVLIGHTGHVKLIDFGIANSPSSHQSENRRAVLGKLGYMAPEQLRLEPADRRSDLYALGVLLWEMLSARSLFRCKRIDDERDWATREVPPPPSTHSASVSPELDRVVLRAIRYEPDQRYPSALELRAALLRAEPTAAKVDAPTFGALLRTLLGEELERRRASLPSEVSIQLDLDAELTPTRLVSLQELTSDVSVDESGPSEPRDDDEDDDDDDLTVIESPHSRRARLSAYSSLPPPPGGATGPRPEALSLAALSSAALVAAPVPCAALAPSQVRPHVHAGGAEGPQPFARAAGARRPQDARAGTPSVIYPSVIYTSPEAGIITVPAPASAAQPAHSLVRAARNHKLRAMAVGVVCLTFGLLLGTRLSGKATPLRVTRDAPAGAQAAGERTPRTRAQRELLPVADAGGALALHAREAREAREQRDDDRTDRERSARASRAAQRRADGISAREAKRAHSTRQRSVRSAKSGKGKAVSSRRARAGHDSRDRFD